MKKANLLAILVFAVVVASLVAKMQSYGFAGGHL